MYSRSSFCSWYMLCMAEGRGRGEEGGGEEEEEEGGEL